GLDDVHPSADAYVDQVRGGGVFRPWTEHWDRYLRYPLEEVPGGVRSRTSRAAVEEDRAYTATQDPYERWAHLTMPTLLVRARWELVPGTGFVVPAGDRDRFRDEVGRGWVVEVGANHLTVPAHPTTVRAVRDFLVAPHR